MTTPLTMAPSRTESPGLASEQPVTNQVKIFPINSKTDLDKAIRQKDLQSLWSLGSSGPPPSNEPHSRHIPAVWKYEDTKALLLKAAEVVDAKEAERRAVLMINPGPKQPPFTLDTLLSAHQLLLPGEQAVCHRHTPFAVRFLIEGDAGESLIRHDGSQCGLLTNRVFTIRLHCHLRKENVHVSLLLCGDKL